jgi:hypothetical protein
MFSCYAFYEVFLLPGKWLLSLSISQYNFMEVHSSWEAASWQLFKNFPQFYGTRRLITVFTRVRHRSLSSARLIQSIPLHPISLRSILILSTRLRLGLPSGLFPSGFNTKIVYAFRFGTMRATCPAHLTPLNLIILFIPSEEYKLLSSPLCGFL